MFASKTLRAPVSPSQLTRQNHRNCPALASNGHRAKPLVLRPWVTLHLWSAAVPYPTTAIPLGWEPHVVTPRPTQTTHTLSSCNPEHADTNTDQPRHWLTLGHNFLNLNLAVDLLNTLIRSTIPSASQDAPSSLHRTHQEHPDKIYARTFDCASVTRFASATRFTAWTRLLSQTNDFQCLPLHWQTPHEQRPLVFFCPVSHNPAKKSTPGSLCTGRQSVLELRKHLPRTQMP